MEEVKRASFVERVDSKVAYKLVVDLVITFVCWSNIVSHKAYKKLKNMVSSIFYYFNIDVNTKEVE